MSFTLNRLRASGALAMALAFFPGQPVRSGGLEGTVTDQAGAPVQNAQVIITGTSYSALTDKKGYYYLARIPSGTYALRASFIGYKKTEVEGVRISDGVTTRQNIRLEKTSVQLEEMSVVAAENPLVPRDAVTTKQSVNMAGAAVAKRERDSRTTYSQALPVSEPNTEDYHYFKDNGFLRPSSAPLSTFAIDVDAASYSNVRRFLVDGQRPPADAIRVEELINYFPYDYPAPRGNDPFSVSTAQMPAPWAPDHRLVLIGLQGKRIDAAELPASNLVFLLDVSGSMQSPDKLPLVKRAFRLLVDQLRPQDRVAIVVYAGAAGLVLPSTPGSDKGTILAAIDQLEAGGSTAGGAGIQLAYDVAQKNHISNGNNRVILATDGDFNVGVSSEGDLVRLIEERKKQGTYLTVLGFGTGNLKDSRMEAMADKGNGHYAYVDNIMEARKVFVQEMGATLVTIAKDTKIQVEFNPAQVAEYRLIGYENRLMAAEDFNDDTKDGGELGAGHAVTALYEVVLTGGRGTGTSVDPLKYQQSRPSGNEGGELLTVKLRYQPPVGSAPSRLITQVVNRDDGAKGTTNLRFAAAVAEYGMLLRNSEYKAQATWENVLALARQNMGDDSEGYRAEFVRLAEAGQGDEPEQ